MAQLYNKQQLREIFQSKLEEIDSRIEVQNEIVHDDMNEEEGIVDSANEDLDEE